jgi:hypothetical protein
MVSQPRVKDALTAGGISKWGRTRVGIGIPRRLALLERRNPYSDALYSPKLKCLAGMKMAAEESSTC